MKKQQLATITLLNVLWLSFWFPSGLATEILPTQTFGISSPNEQIATLDVTLPHFMTLQKFQSAIFSAEQYRGFFPASEAHILNLGLNAFLNSGKREVLLLEALRKDRSVELKFSVPEQTSEFEMSSHPTKPLLYRLEPVTNEVPVQIEIQPLLDGPNAFQIGISKNGEHLVYDVNWAGQVVGFSRK